MQVLWNSKLNYCTLYVEKCAVVKQIIIAEPSEKEEIHCTMAVPRGLDGKLEKSVYTSCTGCVSSDIPNALIHKTDEHLDHPSQNHLLPNNSTSITKFIIHIWQSYDLCMGETRHKCKPSE